MVTVHHRYATVRGQRLFYRESGPEHAPAIVLLHGFPASSFMFRDLIPRLADRYHVIAPDHLGFGLSDCPGVEEFSYTFEALAELTGELLGQLGLNRFALYVHDCGALIGWRLTLATPEAITAIVTQSGNGYQTGFTEDFWTPARAYWREQSPQNEAPLRQALTLEAIRWQYLHGVSDHSLVSPDTWYHDFAQVSRPGNDLIQLRLLGDYAGSLSLYPRLQAYLRERRVPVLAVWGRHDEIFRAEGALAFAGDVPDAEICLLDGGHFLLESHLDATTSTIHDFLGRTLPSRT